MPAETIRQKLKKTISSDICVIGGGLTGIYTALSLAKRGMSVVVLESGRIGSGATGASGGQLVAGVAPDIRTIVNRYGLFKAKFIWDLSVEGLESIKHLAQHEGAPCSLKKGHLLVAETEAQAKSLEQEMNYWRVTLGRESTEMLFGQNLRSMVNTTHYTAGALDSLGAHIDAASFIANLSRSAENEGVRIFENSAVLSLDSLSGQVITREGIVNAQRIVLAAGAWTGTLYKKLARYIGHAYAYACQIEGEDEVAIERLIPSPVAICDYRRIARYFRRHPQGGLHYGSAVSTWSVPLNIVGYRMAKQTMTIFPDTVRWHVKNKWKQSICLTRDMIPHCGKEDKLIWAGGYSGQGLVWAIVMGDLITEAINGNARRFNNFTSIPRRAIAPSKALVPITIEAGLSLERVLDFYESDCKR